MHASFDLYPGYLRHFAGDFDPVRPYRVRYDLHAQRNYKKRRDANGREIVEPQVRPEGSLVIEKSPMSGPGEPVRMRVEHVRAWSIWTDDEIAVQQVLKADIEYAPDGCGSLRKWAMTYHSLPVPPEKFYKFDELPVLSKSGVVEDGAVRISGAAGAAPAGHRLANPASSLYTLIDTLHCGRLKPGRVDYLDDLAMFRPGLEIHRLADSANMIEGNPHTLTGYALVGPAILPQYFWADGQSRVLAIIGRNVAYTLAAVENL